MPSTILEMIEARRLYRKLPRHALESVLETLIVISVFLLVFIFFSKPILEPDTMWHIKTGEYILKHRTIPHFDPFSFAGDKVSFLGQFILSQYWLCQVILYKTYETFGVFGLVMMRAAVFTSIALLLWFLIKEKGFYLPLLITGAVVPVMLRISLEARPQIFTCLFTVLLIFLLEKWKEKVFLRYLLPLPFIMVLWANMHGGFIYGLVVLWIYVVSEIIDMYIKSKAGTVGIEAKSKRTFYYFLVVCFVASVLSLANPNTYKAFLYAWNTQSGSLYNFVQEYQTPLQVTKNAALMSYPYYIYWGFLVFSGLITIVFFWKRRVRPVLLLSFSGLLSLSAIRYISLFAITATSTIRLLPASIRIHTSRPFRKILNMLILLSLWFAMIRLEPFQQGLLFKFNDSRFYPVHACDFMEKNGISGNIFVSYNKSSYVLFRLYPNSKTYYDNRYINQKRRITSQKILGYPIQFGNYFKMISNLMPNELHADRIRVTNTSVEDPGDNLEWKRQLDMINAEIIIHEALNVFDGNLYPTILRLATDDDWRLIYLDGNVMVFVKDIEKFAGIIAKFDKPKSFIFDEIIMEGARHVEEKVPNFYSNAALALLLKGKIDKNTNHIIEKALSLDPGNITANYCSALYQSMRIKSVGGGAG